MGNSRNGGPPFVACEKATLESKEWKELSVSAKLIYIGVKKNHNGRNNGHIPFRYAEVKDQFSSRTIAKALKELIAKGWLERTKFGGLFRFYCEYGLTGRHDLIRTEGHARRNRPMVAFSHVSR